MTEITVAVGYFALFWAGIATICFSLFALLRNQIVFKVRSRELERINRLMDTMLEDGTITLDFVHSTYKTFREAPGYGEMMWDIRKWTYEQFYPASK